MSTPLILLASEVVTVEEPLAAPFTGAQTVTPVRIVAPSVPNPTLVNGFPS